MAGFVSTRRVVMALLACLVVAVAVSIVVMRETQRDQRACTADAVRGPNGEFYSRDPNQGCKFVDHNGKLMPGQG